METEAKLLKGNHTALEKKAGIEAFQRFSYFNTINSLADGDITKWEEIMNYSYSKILVKLQLNKTEAAYQKRYAELLKAQQPTP